jgi:xanthine dehydrogenase accessory factor
MWLESILEWTKQGIPCATVTVTDSAGSTPQGMGAKMAINDRNEIDGTIGGGGVEHHARQIALEALKDGQCRKLRFILGEEHWSVDDEGAIATGDCGGRLTVLIEPIVPQKEIVIFGAGHVAERLAKLCDVLEQPYRVFDDRPEFVSEERFPNATQRITAQWDHIPECISLSAQSFCVVMTYGHQHDEEVLAQLLQNSEIPYIGMIGSVHKVEKRFANLVSQGVVIDERVFSPVGLGLGRNQPGDIALSILSEISLRMHGGDLAHRRIRPAA